MKTLIAIVGFLGCLSLTASWLDRRDGAAGSYIVAVLGVCLLALDVGLVVVYALYRLFFT